MNANERESPTAQGSRAFAFIRGPLVLACAFTLCAQPASYLGAAACGACHPTQFKTQSATSHARSLSRALERAGSIPTEPFLRPPNFHFQFLRSQQGLRVKADDGQYVTELPVEWAFGAGEHAVTFVSKVDGQFYLEHSLSYYADTKSLDITPGHESLPSTTLHEAMGQPVKIRGSGATIQKCFECHSTGPVSVSAAGEVQITETGVHCEVCHGPGGAHREAAGRGQLEPATKLIRKPSARSGEELNKLCGTCHRALTADFNRNSPWNVRHQPPYLAQSRCFQKSNDALSCLTCHDPHDRVRRNDAALYRQKCVGCHTASTRPPRPICQAEAAPDCTSCHMPSVQANSHLTFKNHWIGVYLKGATMRPSR